MSDDDNLKKTFDNVNENLEKKFTLQEFEEMQMRKLKEELVKKISEYKHTMHYMACDAPLEILCLPDSVIKVLKREGFLRVYDFIDKDLTKIKGLGVSRIRDLTSRLEQFFSML